MKQDPQEAQDRYHKKMLLQPLAILRNDFKTEKESELDQFIYQELGRIIKTLNTTSDTNPEAIRKSVETTKKLISKITQTNKDVKTTSNTQRRINIARRIVISLLMIPVPIATLASMVVSFIIYTVISRTVKKEQTIHENRLEGLKNELKDLNKEEPTSTKSSEKMPQEDGKHPDDADVSTSTKGSEITTEKQEDSEQPDDADVSTSTRGPTGP